MGKCFIRSANNLINSISIIWKIIKKKRIEKSTENAVYLEGWMLFVWAEKIICLEKGKKKV